VNVREFPFAVQIGKAGIKGEPFDMNLIGWFADYPDRYDFINVLLYGKTISKANNVNTAYQLDLELTRAAPFVVYATRRRASSSPSGSAARWRRRSPAG
jgi:hypothetical protein